MEGNRPWWGGWASNPVGGAMRRRVGSTPASFRQDSAQRVITRLRPKLMASTAQTSASIATITLAACCI